MSYLGFDQPERSQGVDPNENNNNGGLAVQIAKALGAGLAIPTAATEEKRAFTRNIGAAVAVDYWS